MRGLPARRKARMAFEDGFLALALAIGAFSCNRESLSEVVDASRDGAVDSTRLDECPRAEPPDGESCYSGNSVGLSCTYGVDLCTCVNGGQGGARWSCTGPLGGPGPGDGGIPSVDGASGIPDCVYNDGGSQLDAAGRFRGSCSSGCPSGTICAVEIGGVAGGGGEYCAPIVDRCRDDLSCACLASCVCGSSHGRAEQCATARADGGEVVECDDGIR